MFSSRSDADYQYVNSTISNSSCHCNKTVPWDCLQARTSAYIYISFLGLMFLFGLLRSWTLFTIGVRCSKSFHEKLYSAVVRAPIRFHDTNPKGTYSFALLMFSMFYYIYNHHTNQQLVMGSQLIVFMHSALAFKCCDKIT